MTDQAVRQAQGSASSSSTSCSASTASSSVYFDDWLGHGKAEEIITRKDEKHASETKRGKVHQHGLSSVGTDRVVLRPPFSMKVSDRDLDDTTAPSSSSSVFSAAKKTRPHPSSLLRQPGGGNTLLMTSLARKHRSTPAEEEEDVDELGEVDRTPDGMQYSKKTGRSAHSSLRKSLNQHHQHNSTTNNNNNKVGAKRLQSAEKTMRSVFYTIFQSPLPTLAERLVQRDSENTSTLAAMDRDERQATEMVKNKAAQNDCSISLSEHNDDIEKDDNGDNDVSRTEGRYNVFHYEKDESGDSLFPLYRALEQKNERDKDWSEEEEEEEEQASSSPSLPQRGWSRSEEMDDIYAEKSSGLVAAADSPPPPSYSASRSLDVWRRLEEHSALLPQFKTPSRSPTRENDDDNHDNHDRTHALRPREKTVEGMWPKQNENEKSDSINRRSPQHPYSHTVLPPPPASLASLVEKDRQRGNAVHLPQRGGPALAHPADHLGDVVSPTVPTTTSVHTTTRCHPYDSQNSPSHEERRREGTRQGGREEQSWRQAWHPQRHLNGETRLVAARRVRPMEKAEATTSKKKGGTSRNEHVSEAARLLQTQDMEAVREILSHRCILTDPIRLNNEASEEMNDDEARGGMEKQPPHSHTTSSTVVVASSYERPTDTTSVVSSQWAAVLESARSMLAKSRAEVDARLSAVAARRLTDYNPQSTVTGMENVAPRKTHMVDMTYERRRESDTSQQKKKEVVVVEGGERVVVDGGVVEEKGKEKKISDAVSIPVLHTTAPLLSSSSSSSPTPAADWTSYQGHPFALVPAPPVSAAAAQRIDKDAKMETLTPRVYTYRSPCPQLHYTSAQQDGNRSMEAVAPLAHPHTHRAEKIISSPHTTGVMSQAPGESHGSPRMTLQGMPPHPPVESAPSPSPSPTVAPAATLELDVSHPNVFVSSSPCQARMCSHSTSYYHKHPSPAVPQQHREKTTVTPEVTPSASTSRPLFQECRREPAGVTVGRTGGSRAGDREREHHHHHHTGVGDDTSIYTDGSSSMLFGIPPVEVATEKDGKGGSAGSPNPLVLVQPTSSQQDHPPRRYDKNRYSEHLGCEGEIEVIASPRVASGASAEAIRAKLPDLTLPHRPPPCEFFESPRPPSGEAHDLHTTRDHSLVNREPEGNAEWGRLKGSNGIVPRTSQSETAGRPPGWSSSSLSKETKKLVETATSPIHPSPVLNPRHEEDSAAWLHVRERVDIRKGSGAVSRSPSPTPPGEVEKHANSKSSNNMHHPPAAGSAPAPPAGGDWSGSLQSTPIAVPPLPLSALDGDTTEERNHSWSYREEPRQSDYHPRERRSNRNTKNNNNNNRWKWNENYPVEEEEEEDEEEDEWEAAVNAVSVRRKQHPKAPSPSSLSNTGQPVTGTAKQVTFKLSSSASPDTTGTGTGGAGGASSTRNPRSATDDFYHKRENDNNNEDEEEEEEEERRALQKVAEIIQRRGLLDTASRSPHPKPPITHTSTNASNKKNSNKQLNANVVSGGIPLEAQDGRRYTSTTTTTTTTTPTTTSGLRRSAERERSPLTKAPRREELLLGVEQDLARMRAERDTLLEKHTLLQEKRIQLAKKMRDLYAPPQASPAGAIGSPSRPGVRASPNGKTSSSSLTSTTTWRKPSPAVTERLMKIARTSQAAQEHVEGQLALLTAAMKRMEKQRQVLLSG